jgi:hypothetical protein
MQFEVNVSDVAGITLQLRSYSQVIHAANVRLPWGIGFDTPGIALFVYHFYTNSFSPSFVSDEQDHDRRTGLEL